MKTFLLTLVTMFGVVVSGASSRAQALFQDSFSNGIPADSDSEPGIWTPYNFSPSTHVESGGKFVQTASDPTSATALAALATPVQSRFNFFTNQLKFGAAIRVTGMTEQTWMARSRLILSPTVGQSSVIPTALGVLFRKQQVLGLSRKQNAPYVEVDNTSHAAVSSLMGAVYTGDDVERFELVLNDSTYQLTTFGGGKGCGIFRFSGTHGIQAANWGNGNSSVALETLRIASAGGTNYVTGTWDDVKVDFDFSTIAPEPYRDFTVTYARPGGTTQTGNFSVWVPTGVGTIRGIIFIAPGSGEDFRYFVHDRAAQEGARAMGFGLIAYTNQATMNLETFASSDATYIKTAVQAVLDQAASLTGRPEISNAPLCWTGHSAGAFNSATMATHWPERMIAFVAHRGAGSTLGALPEASKYVPGGFVAGSTDGNSITGPAQMRNIFEGWRAFGAQVALAIDWQVGHNPRGNQGWEATFAFFQEIAALRYPRPMQPSPTPGAGFPTLLTLSTASGWLAETPDFTNTVTPVSTSPFLAIAPFATYTGPVNEASWLPNESTARLYRALTSTDLVSRSFIPKQGPLSFVEPAQFDDTARAAIPLTLTIDPREADDVRPLVSVEFYDGAELIATRSSGPPWSVSYTPRTPGLHTITAVSTDTAGQKRDALRVITVRPSSRQLWNDTHFGTGGAVDNRADFDSDGYGELQEFAFGLDPKSSDGPRVGFSCVPPSSPGLPLKFLYRRNTSAVNLTYQVEGSSDLKNWTILSTSSHGKAPVGPAPVEEVSIPSAPGVNTVTVTDTVPFQSANRRFLRLRLIEK